MCQLKQALSSNNAKRKCDIHFISLKKKVKDCTKFSSDVIEKTALQLNRTKMLSTNLREFYHPILVHAKKKRNKLHYKKEKKKLPQKLLMKQTKANKSGL